MMIYEKQKFVNDLIDGVRSAVLKRIDLLPDKWNEEELLRYVADKFMDQPGALMPGNVRSSGSSIRMRDYRNEIINRGL